MNFYDSPLELATVVAEELQTILAIADDMTAHLVNMKSFSTNSDFYDSTVKDLEIVAEKLNLAASYSAFAINGLINMGGDATDDDD